MVEVHRLGPQIGAEIRGVDARSLDDATFAVIYRAWLDHNVVVVPGQELTIEQFLAYSRRFGRIEPHPSKATRHPEIRGNHAAGHQQIRRRRQAERCDLPARRRGLAHRRRV